MGKGKVVYYLTTKGENPVSDFLDTLSGKQQGKLLRIFSNIEEYGLSVAIPHIKKLTGTPLWEIRVLGQDNIRVLYVTYEINGIVVIHGFIKKKQKTPKREIQTALARYADWQSKNKP